MKLDELPFEVFERIVQNVSFVDLPYFLQVSRSVHSLFEGTRYPVYLRFVCESNLRYLHNRMSKFPIAWDYWTTGNVLTEYASSHCHQCDEFAFQYMWAAFPPMKLCTRCLAENPRFAHVELQEGRKMCGLQMRDVEGFPLEFVSARAGGHNVSCFASISKCLVLRHSLISVAEEKGSIPETDNFGKTYRYTDGVRKQAALYRENFLGCVRVRGTFDYETRRVYEDVHCGRCEWHPSGADAGSTWWRGSAPFATADSLAISIIPRSYKALRLHTQKYHPEVLATFDAGWNSLPAKVQARWTHPQVAVGTSFLEWWYNDIFLSWTHEMHDEHELRRRNEKDDKRTRNEQKEQCVLLICDNMAHEGTLVRMPPLLDDGMDVPFVSGTQLKEDLVCMLVDEYFFQVRSKAAEWLKDKVEREGVMFLEPLLNKHEIFEIRDKSG